MRAKSSDTWQFPARRVLVRLSVWTLTSALLLALVAAPSARAQRKQIRIQAPLRIRLAGEVGATAEDTAPSPSSTAPGAIATGKQLLPIFYLRDKSRIAGWPQIENLEVQTLYGQLSIPRDQLIRIRFARRLAPELKEKIERLVSDLADEDFDKREAATEELRKIGPPTLANLRKAVKSSNEEVKSRAGSLVAEINEQISSSESEEEDSLRPLSGGDDEIITTRMTIRGTILTPDFAVKSKYGHLRVLVADLRGVSFKASVPTSAKVAVTAQHQAPGKWLDTKLDAQRGERVKITASGNISVQNYGIVSGPAGNRDWSGHATFGNFPMLSVVAKVGKKGKPFLVGASYSGRIKGQGRLYLGVVPFSPYPTGAAGSYQVKVQTLGSE